MLHVIRGFTILTQTGKVYYSSKDDVVVFPGEEGEFEEAAIACKQLGLRCPPKAQLDAVDVHVDVPTVEELREQMRAAIEPLGEPEYAEVTEDGQRRGSIFLGSVFTLFPSGKYYMPWACSNVDPCPICQGTGKVGSPTADPLRHDVYEALVSTLIGKLLAGFGDHTRWPEDLRKMVDGLREKAQATQLANECPACGGHASLDVRNDTLFSEMLEEYLEARGFSLEAGEGDPCDLFAIRYTPCDQE